MLDDILRQPESLRKAWMHQFGEGSGRLLAGARAIASAQRVVLTGMGSSLFAAIPAAYYLEQHGVAAECVETSELLHFRHSSLNPHTTVVVISRSGESVETVKLLPLLAASGARVIGVTNVENSRLAREAPLSILFQSANDRMVSVQSYTSSVAVLLTLAAASLDQSLEGWAKARDGVCERVAEAAKAAVEGAGGWIEFDAGADAIYLLGRGASLASAHEGALLFHEAARTRAAAMSTAQFRHGPIEVTGAGMSAIIFPSPGPARELDLALAADMRQMGARVQLCDGQGIVDPFAPVVEIIPVQVAACALALSQGLDPGDFRYASLVTANEAGFRSLG